MLAGKIVVCASLFAASLAGGWIAELSVRESRAAGPAAYRAVEEGIAIVRASAYPAFRSREYVKIIRLTEPRRTNRTAP